MRRPRVLGVEMKTLPVNGLGVTGYPVQYAVLYRPGKLGHVFDLNC